MKQIALFAAAAMIAMGAASAASAGVYNASIDLTSVKQVTGDTVNQKAASIAIAVGSMTSASQSSSALNALQVAEVTKGIDTELGSAPDGSINGVLELNGLNQRTDAAVHQASLSIAGSGALNMASQTSEALNVVQDANVSVNLTTKH